MRAGMIGRGSFEVLAAASGGFVTAAVVLDDAGAPP
jgi:hypothetical protein